MNGHRGWCNCQSCPQGVDNLWGSNFIQLPKYSRNHWHHICDWCELWAKHAPEFATTPFYLQNIETMHGIHAFFAGYPLAPYKIAQCIYTIAEEVALTYSRGLRHRRLERLVRDLEDLADQVQGGLFVNYHRPGWGQQQRWAAAGRMLTGIP